ncbi:hypothetical protein L7F22_066478 [Adiantum nelumboides]|nr:hypothetical protein [Adiantum nelumboides]
MIRRCDPSRRRYTELCNRSGSPLLQPTHSQMYGANALEDYWEDASVSLRTCHSWDAPSSGWLEASAPDISPITQIAQSRGLCDSGYRRVRPCRYSFDASDYLGPVKGRRCFPPPMASCSTLSIKEGGRFVLKEMDADRPQGFFRAQRENGRLVLQLVLPDESNEDGVPVNEEICDGDDFGVTDEDESTCSFADYSEDSGSGLCDEVVQVEHDPQDEELSKRDCFGGSSIEEVIVREVFDGSCEGVNVKERDSAYQEQEFLDSATSVCAQLRDAGPKTGEMKLSSTRENVQEEEYLVRLEGGCHGSVDVGQFVAESRLGPEQVDAFSHQHEECLWNADMANHALTNRSAWSANQLCLHQSLINVRPALGLAMS